MSRGKSWSKEDEKFLREHFSTMSNEELMEILFRSEKSIQAKANVLKLLKERHDICKFPSITIKMEGSFIDAVSMDEGMDGFIRLLKRQAHKIRPALRRGTKFTIEAE